MSSLANRSLRILLFFVILAGLPLVALSWLGWHFLQQDRDLELQRQQEQLQNASELLARDLRAQLDAVERQLRGNDRDPPVIPGPGAFFRIRDGRVSARTGAALPFYPITTALADIHAPVFATAERLEFVAGRCDLALNAYRELATQAHANVRPAALMRLARCLRKLGRNAEALETYGELSALGGTTVGGLPAELLARRERVDLLVSAGKVADARAEEHRLRELLLKGQFTIDRGTLEFFAEKVGLGQELFVHLPLALAGEHSATQWHGETCGRVAGRFAAFAVLGAWCRNTNKDVDVMLVPADAWFERLRPAAEAMKLAVAVDDSLGTVVWGAVPTGINVTRQLSDLALPWRLRVGSANPEQAAALSSRRRAFAAVGLALMVVIVAAAAFFVFRAVNRELEVAQLQADFISTVSHEFRTPLTAMTHLTEMLQDAAVPVERVPHYYGALHRETQRLQRLVEGLLDFRRFEAGRRAYRMEPMDAEEAVRQAVDSYASRDDTRRLHVSFGNAGATIHGDREAVVVAISNLLDNALKYSPADTPVSVQVQPRGAMLGISVEDRGPGISRGERSRVFRKFVRGAAAQQGNVKGTGIGLAIVQAVVKAHGGRLDLDSVPGQGSRFTVLLPRLR